jgi:hypothetical protein
LSKPQRPRLRGHSGTLAQAKDLSAECENGRMSLSAWLRIGWFIMAADVAYFLLGGTGQLDDTQSISQWHERLNGVLWYGGALLFFVLLILSYLSWRVNERERMRT